MKCKCGKIGRPRNPHGLYSLLPPEGWQWEFDLKTDKNTYYCPECSKTLQKRGRKTASNGQTRGGWGKARV